MTFPCLADDGRQRRRHGAGRPATIPQRPIPNDATDGDDAGCSDANGGDGPVDGDAEERRWTDGDRRIRRQRPTPNLANRATDRMTSYRWNYWPVPSFNAVALAFCCVFFFFFFSPVSAAV